MFLNAERLARLASRLGMAGLALSIRARSFLETGEPEAHLLPWLVPKGMVAVDVGAANGVYSFILRSLGARVVAFEPNPTQCGHLRRALRGVDVRDVALSNRSGVDALRVPVVKDVAYAGWGTVSARNLFPELSPAAVLEYEVKVATLDSFGLDDVGFIKIDVEGLELEVLQGAESLISRCLPTILLELGNEARGSAPVEVWSFLRSKGYVMLGLDERRSLRSLESVPRIDGSLNLIALPQGR